MFSRVTQVLRERVGQTEERGVAFFVDVALAGELSGGLKFPVVLSG